MKQFEEIRVVEIAGSAAGAYAAKLFADYGADVVRIELAERPRPHAERIYLDTSKKLLSAPSSEVLGEAVRRADVVVESSAPEPLEPVTATLAQPRLVRTWISPFGVKGPYSSYRSTEMTDEALAGHLWLNGEPDREPIQRPGLHAHYQAGAHAFIGSAAALLARERTGQGQTVEVTHQEGLAAMHQYTTVMYSQAAHTLRREGNRQGGHWHPVGVYPCKDGHVHLSMPSIILLEPFLRAAGLDAIADDARFIDDVAKGQHKREFDEAILPWLMEHTAEEIIALGQAARAPIGPVLGHHDIVECEHLRDRGYWREIPTRDGRTVRVPRGPALIDGRDSSQRPPTALEADELLAGWDVTAQPVKSAAAADVADGPLTGVRILDLTRVWAGPLTTRILGDLGADVIKVEAPWARGAPEVPKEAGKVSHLFPDEDPGDEPYNREMTFTKLNRNKRGLTLALTDPTALELFRRLVADADVVIENYSPRVMPKLGLGPDELRALNSSALYVCMPGFGRSGPWRDWLAFGPLIEAACGLSSQMGYPDSGPYRSGVAWADPVTSLHAASAIMVALLDREADSTRSARTVEVPMLESMICFLGDQIVASQLRGRDPDRIGNRHPGRAPQGLYRTRGNDRWLAVSVTENDEWRALRREIGAPEGWASWTLAQRIDRHDEIDAVIAEWCADRDADAAMENLQNIGVAATVAADAARLVNDPNLAARGFWAEVEHKVVGRRRYPGLPIHLSDTPATYRRAAPCLGQHNHEVLRELLGIDDAELTRLEDAGILVTKPPPGATSRGIR